MSQGTWVRKGIIVILMLMGIMVTNWRFYSENALANKNMDKGAAYKQEPRLKLTWKDINYKVKAKYSNAEKEEMNVSER